MVKKNRTRKKYRKRKFTQNKKKRRRKRRKRRRTRRRGGMNNPPEKRTHRSDLLRPATAPAPGTPRKKKRFRLSPTPSANARAASGLAGTADLMSKLAMVTPPPPPPSLSPRRLDTKFFSGPVATSPIRTLRPLPAAPTPRPLPIPPPPSPPPPQPPDDLLSRTKMLEILPTIIKEIREILSLPEENAESVTRWIKRFIQGEVFLTVRNKYLKNHEGDSSRMLVVTLAALYELLYVSANAINNQVNLNNIHKITNFYNKFLAHTTKTINRDDYMKVALDKASRSNFVLKWLWDDEKKREATEREKAHLSAVNEQLATAVNNENSNYDASSQQTQNQV